MIRPLEREELRLIRKRAAEATDTLAVRDRRSLLAELDRVQWEIEEERARVENSVRQGAGGDGGGAARAA